MMEEQIRARRLPPLFDGEVNAQNFDEWRKNIVDLYAHECFGVTPPAPREVRAVVVEQNDDDWAGKAEHRKVMLSFDMENGEFSFPVHLVIPKAGRPCPCVVYPSFTPYATAGYQPIEEIVDQGFALAVFCYEDVTRDNEDFTDGLAAMTSRGAADDWGKIGMWAFACSRVLDHLLTLPEIDGIQLLRRMKADPALRDIPVIMATAKGAEYDKIQSLDLGADDYLVKPFALEELSARLRVLTRSQFGAGDSRLVAGDLTLDTGTRRVKRGGAEIALSAREYALLEYLMHNKGIVLSREKIENHVWNFDYEGGTNVVDVYIRYLRKKIDDGHERKLIHTVRGMGYVLREETP